MEVRIYVLLEFANVTYLNIKFLSFQLTRSSTVADLNIFPTVFESPERA